MKALRLYFVLGLLLGLASAVHALQDPGPDPNNGASWAGHNDPDPGDIPNIVGQNASTPPGNPAGTWYWFAASDSQSNSTYANGNIVGSSNGHTVLSTAAYVATGTGYTELIGGLVDPLLAGTTYWVFAQACLTGHLANEPGQCSNWIRLASIPALTPPLPSAPFIAPVHADVGTDSITIHASVPDPTNVEFWSIELDRLQPSFVMIFGSGLTKSYTQSQQVVVGAGETYNFALVPNTRYQYQGRLEYYWGQFAPATPQIESFTTTPVQPGTSTVSNVTHCSAQITVLNATSTVANPVYTDYHECFGTNCQDALIGGTTIYTDSITVTFSNLSWGQAFNGTSQALNEDANWNNSQTNSVPLFTTQDWGGNFAVGTISLSSAIVTVTGITGSGSIQSWKIIDTNSNTVLASGSGDPTPASPIVLTHLNSGTSYNTVMQLTESGTSCASSHATTPSTWRTDGPYFAVAPAIALKSDKKSAVLSALGADNNFSESSLIYQWSLFSGPGGAIVDYSDNNDNTAKDTTVTFRQAGTYVFQCEVIDPLNEEGFANTPSTGVVQALTAITVSPNNSTVNAFQNQQFTASESDQFNNALNPALPVTWSTTVGNITGSGQFSSPQVGSNIKVTATDGTVSGFAIVTVINYDLSVAHAHPNPYKSTEASAIVFNNLGSDAKIRVYTITGRLVFNTETTAGEYSWAVTNNSGEKVASGVYYYVIESPSQKKQGKLIIIQ